MTGIIVIVFLLMKVLLREHELSPKEGGLGMMATEINKHAPRALDSVIRLDYVHVLNDSSVQYYHTLRNMDRQQMNTDSFAKQMKRKIIAAETEDIRYCRRYGVEIEWRYVDGNKAEICVIHVGRNDLPVAK